MPQDSHVACVEDDPAVRDALAKFLKSHGITTSGFVSAEDFLQCGNIKNTWCMITDLQLPGLSGLQLRSKLLQDGIDIPTIIVTGFPNSVLKKRALELRTLCFLTKPVKENELLSCIEAARKCIV